MPRILPIPKKHDIFDNAYEGNDSPTVAEKIEGKRRAINWPITGKSILGDV